MGCASMGCNVSGEQRLNLDKQSSTEPSCGMGHNERVEDYNDEFTAQVLIAGRTYLDSRDVCIKNWSVREKTIDVVETFTTNELFSTEHFLNKKDPLLHDLLTLRLDKCLELMREVNRVTEGNENISEFVVYSAHVLEEYKQMISIMLRSDKFNERDKRSLFNNLRILLISTLTLDVMIQLFFMRNINSTEI